jgi:dTDP-glucose pyrophosphorylase
VTNRLEPFVVGTSSTLVEAMRTLERNASGIVLVVDGQRLIGTVTDGDIRRALLGGGTLNSPLLSHLQRDCITVGPDARRAEVLDLMQARRIRQIPIVGPDGVLLGLHLLHEILGGVERPNWAVIMAGGRGTRLRPITDHIPKSMVRIAGRPILERLVLHLVGFGIRRIFLSINYLGHVIEQHFGDGSRHGCRIAYLREDRPMGTGGALSLLPEAPSVPLMVMNGDLVTQADIGAMLEAHERGGVMATLAVRRYFYSIPFGCVELDGARVVRMDEKPKLMRMVNAGIYVLSPELVARVPKKDEFPLPALLEQCLVNGEPIQAFEIEDDWIDVGRREQLDEASGASLSSS